jgi:metallophosphoesterase superfamily enzyme
LLTSLTSRLDWTWIVGNHDPGFADHCGGRIEDEVELGGIMLRHEAQRGEARPEISGHYHPKFRVHLCGRQVSRRCFVTSASKVIMPAFGSLTGGLDAHHPAILGSVGSNAAALVPVSDRLLRFPLAA